MGRFSNGTGIDQEAALFHLKCAADYGVIEAMKNLAFMYYKMPHDILEQVEINDVSDQECSKQGYHYMEEAAKAGDRSSMIFIAKSLDSGLNLPNGKIRSTRAAIDWYEKISEMDREEIDKVEWGLEDAPCSLLARQAEIWLIGEGDVEKDPILAGDLFNLAAESAMNCMRGKLANKFYMRAEEAFVQAEDMVQE